MLFFNVRQNSKCAKMSILKIVMAIVLFVALSDKMLFQNFMNCLDGRVPNFMSIEKFVHDVVNISKIITTSFSITLSVGAIFVQIALMIGVALALFFVVRVLLMINSSAEENAEYKSVHVVAYATNDIYLQTNKFIC